MGQILRREKIKSYDHKVTQRFYWDMIVRELSSYICTFASNEENCIYDFFFFLFLLFLKKFIISHRIRKYGCYRKKYSCKGHLHKITFALCTFKNPKWHLPQKCLSFCALYMRPCAPFCNFYARQMTWFQMLKAFSEWYRILIPIQRAGSFF